MIVVFYIIQLKKTVKFREQLLFRLLQWCILFVFKGEFRQTDKGKKGNAWYIITKELYKSWLPPLRCFNTVYLSTPMLRGSGRVFSGFGIWPKYGAGIGKTINILTGSGIWLFPGKRDSPKIGYGMRDLCFHVCRECRKPSRPTGSSGQSESTRRALSDVSFQTKRPMEYLVNGS